MALTLDSNFDSGAIDVVAINSAAAEVRIRSDLKADGTRSEFAQWFHFRIDGIESAGARVDFTNAGDTTYPAGWKDYRAAASRDGRRWTRVPTRYDGRTMSIDLPPAPAMYVAYFEPYSWERHLALLGRAEASPLARVTRLGGSVEGRDMRPARVR